MKICATVLQCYSSKTHEYRERVKIWSIIIIYLYIIYNRTFFCFQKEKGCIFNCSTVATVATVENN